MTKNVLQLIASFTDRSKKQATWSEVYELLHAIRAAELRRIRLEAEHLLTQQVKLSKVSVKPAQEALEANGLILDVVQDGPMWVVVELNDIERGVLAACHIVGVPHDPNAPKVVHHVPLGNVTDYDRIG